MGVWGCLFVCFFVSVDKIKSFIFFPTAQMTAETMHSRCTKLFDGILDIDDKVIVLDARDTKTEGVATLKAVLKQRKENIIVGFSKITRK